MRHLLRQNLRPDALCDDRLEIPSQQRRPDGESRVKFFQ